MKFLKSIQIFFAKLFGWKYEVDNQLARRVMYRHFYATEWGYETSITQVKVFREKGKLIVMIETHRPGLLIGKAGHYIDSLKKELEEEFKEEIKIDLKECKLWHNLYNLRK
ncbi:MAG: KH domain-containing protein [Nanoarchaeota archaeon]